MFELGGVLSVKVVGCSLDNRGIVVPIAARSRDFSLAQSVLTDPLIPFDLLFSGCLDCFSPGQDGRGVMLNIHLHVVQRLRMSWAVPLLILVPLQRVRRLYFYQSLFTFLLFYMSPLYTSLGNFSGSLPWWHVVSSDKLPSRAPFAIYWYWVTGSECFILICATCQMSCDVKSGE